MLSEEMNFIILQVKKLLPTVNNSFPGHTMTVLSCCFSSDNRWLISGSVDLSIKVWDVSTKANIATLLGHNQGIISVAISKDMRWLVSGSDDRFIKGLFVL